MVPMSTELSLRFMKNNRVIVGFSGEESGELPFKNPLTAKDRGELRWYLEL